MPLHRPFIRSIDSPPNWCEVLTAGSCTRSFQRFCHWRQSTNGPSVISPAPSLTPIRGRLVSSLPAMAGWNSFALPSSANPISKRCTKLSTDQCWEKQTSYRPVLIGTRNRFDTARSLGRFITIVCRSGSRCLAIKEPAASTTKRSVCFTYETDDPSRSRGVPTSPQTLTSTILSEFWFTNDAPIVLIVGSMRSVKTLSDCGRIKRQESRSFRYTKPSSLAYCRPARKTMPRSPQCSPTSSREQ